SAPPPEDADPNPPGETRAVAFTADGKCLLTGHGSYWWPTPGQMRSWNADTGAELRRIEGPWFPTDLVIGPQAGEGPAPATVAVLDRTRRLDTVGFVRPWNPDEGGFGQLSVQLGLGITGARDGLRLAAGGGLLAAYPAKPGAFDQSQMRLLDPVGLSQKAFFLLPSAALAAAPVPGGPLLAA